MSAVSALETRIVDTHRFSFELSRDTAGENYDIGVGNSFEVVLYRFLPDNSEVYFQKGLARQLQVVDFYVVLFSFLNRETVFSFGIGILFPCFRHFFPVDDDTESVIGIDGKQHLSRFFGPEHAFKTGGEIGKVYPRLEYRVASGIAVYRRCIYLGSGYFSVQFGVIVISGSHTPFVVGSVEPVEFRFVRGVREPIACFCISNVADFLFYAAEQSDSATGSPVVVGPLHDRVVCIGAHDGDFGIFSEG